MHFDLLMNSDATFKDKVRLSLEKKTRSSLLLFDIHWPLSLYSSEDKQEEEKRSSAGEQMYA